MVNDESTFVDRLLHHGESGCWLHVVGNVMFMIEWLTVGWQWLGSWFDASQWLKMAHYG